MMSVYMTYVDDVLSGKIPAGELIILAVKRFCYFLKRDDVEFKKEKADRVIAFISCIKHYRGKHRGKRFILEPWQQFIVAFVYGFYEKSTGLRLVQFLYLEIPRKNGKSALAAALGLYHLIGDGEGGAQVYFAANSKDQVKLSSWPLCSNFAKALTGKTNDLIIHRDTVTFHATDSFLKVLASDSTKLDGPDPSFFLLDEFHAAKNTLLKDVLQSGQGSRENPLGAIVTTAGFDLLGPCYEYRTMCIEILKGLKADDSIAAFIWSPDKTDDWKSPSTWEKVNPNIDITVTRRFIEREVRRAINSPSEEVGVKTKTLNIWCDSIDVWIPESYILDSSKNINIEDFGKDDECFVGIDLSSTSDLTCVSYMIPINGKFYFKTKYYLPREALSTKKHKDLYGEWERMGLLIVTPGNVVDYDYVLNEIIDTDKKVFISKIGYDSWNATQFVINAENKGLPMEPYSQTIGNFNRPTKELERIILSGNAVIDNSIITRHCFRNVVLARDTNGNIKPSKQFDDKKIDGVIAMIEALGVYLLTPHYNDIGL